MNEMTRNKNEQDEPVVSERLKTQKEKADVFIKKQKRSASAFSYLRNQKNNYNLRLKLRTLRIPWKRNHISDITHTGYKLYQALKPKPKACMRTGTEFPCFQIPP